jgi:peptide/nickel transport system substrate-binding protein
MARSSYAAITSSILVIVLAAAAVSMTLPSAGIGNDGIRASVEAGPGDRTFTIGVPDMYVNTLNPFFYTGSAEYMTIWPCYSSLLTYDADGAIIGDLADSWSVSGDGMTWTFNLVQNARFYDPGNPDLILPVTTDDVIFTLDLCQHYEHNLQYLLPNGVISEMTAAGPYTLTIELSHPYAPLLASMAAIPILPKAIWYGHDVDWPNFDDSAGIWPCIGSGPMYYALPGMPSTYVEMRPNPVWFQTENRGWQIHPDRVVYLQETVDSATVHLLNGVIDVYQNVPPSVYMGLQPLPSGIQGFAQSTGLVYEFNLNQLSDENRDLYRIGNQMSYNNQLLLDPIVKAALAMSVDKNAFIDIVLNGFGTPADSLIPDSSFWHYTYGSIPGEVPIQFDPFGARMMLYDNGWNFRLDGSQILPYDPDYWAYWPLSKSTDGVATDTLSFRFFAPNTGAEYTEGAMLIQNWARDAGVDLMLDIVTVSQMNSAWYNADYDVWLWNWMFAPLSDPSTEEMSVLTSMEIGGWSDVFYSNETYDELWLQSLSEMNIAIRKMIIDELQRMAYEDMGCQCVAYGKSICLVSSNTAEHWTNYGDWEDQVLLMPEFALPYLYMRIMPADNPAPQITAWLSDYETMPTIPIDFTAAAVDNDPLEYRWNFGDGTMSDWSPSPSATHLYSSEGIFTAYLMVREVYSADQFMTWAAATVIVWNPTNVPPCDLSFVYSPTAPFAGEIILFEGSAYDPDGDELVFTWDFGDGGTASGASVTHVYAAGGYYLVTMFVDDGHVSHPGGVRPVTTTQLVFVLTNSAPIVSVSNFTDVLRKSVYTFEVSASDADGDLLLFTWYWGDGTVSVTSNSTCDHIYEKKGTYVLTVVVSDQTGLPGHEVEASGTVTVIWIPPGKLT